MAKEVQLVSTSEYEGLLDIQKMFLAFMATGVENWEGYDDAIDAYDEMKENERKVEQLKLFEFHEEF